MTSTINSSSHIGAFMEFQNAAASVPLLWLKRAVAPAQPTGMTRHRFSCEAGSRFYHLYTPKSGAQPPTGILVMLHGCKQSAIEFADATRMNKFADRFGLIVVYPEQSLHLNALGCWQWYLPKNQRRGRGEPAILAALTEFVRLSTGVAAQNVFAAGLSAGGSMAAILGAVYPDVFAGVGVHSGLMCGAAQDVTSAFDAMSKGYKSGAGAAKMPPKSRMIVFHGLNDQKVVPQNGTSLFEAVCEGRPRKPILRVTDVLRGSRQATRAVLRSSGNAALAELWMIAGTGHAWSGGLSGGSYSDPLGPNASEIMARFFLDPKNDAAKPAVPVSHPETHDLAA